MGAGDGRRAVQWGVECGGLVRRGLGREVRLGRARGAAASWPAQCEGPMHAMQIGATSVRCAVRCGPSGEPHAVEGGQGGAEGPGLGGAVVRGLSHLYTSQGGLCRS